MQQIRYFVALAQTLNFTRAAEQCHVSQPALTRAIQQLEHELGGPLFHRERNNTHLSELGRLMQPYLESVAQSAQAAKAAAISVKKAEKVTLTIGAMCTIGPQLVSELIVEFQRTHPDVEIRLIEDDSSAMIAALERGDLHVALVGVPGELPGNFHQLPIYSERFVIVLPQGHRWAQRNAIRVAELHGEPYVGRSTCEVYKMVSEDFAQRGVKLKKVFSSPRDDWVKNMIKAGLGFGFFPEHCVDDPQLVMRPLIEPEYRRTIYLATVRGRPHSPAVGAFVSAARRFGWAAEREAA